MWGAKIGLCLPRRMRATWAARRPRVRPSASTTYQVRLMSCGRGENVRWLATGMRANSMTGEGVGRTRARAYGTACPCRRSRLAVVAAGEQVADDAAHHLPAERVGHHPHLDQAAAATHAHGPQPADRAGAGA